MTAGTLAGESHTLPSFEYQISPEDNNQDHRETEAMVKLAPLGWVMCADLLLAFPIHILLVFESPPLSSSRLCGLGQFPPPMKSDTVFSLQLSWNDLGMRQGQVIQVLRFRRLLKILFVPLTVAMGSLRPCCCVSGLCLVRSWEQVGIGCSFFRNQRGDQMAQESPVISTRAFSHWAL